MSVTYREFLDQAVSFLDIGHEIGFRCGTSRGYYGLYHCALAFADSVTMPPISDCSGPTHKKLRCFFEDQMDSDRARRLKLRSIGARMKQLHELRVAADYGIHRHFAEEDARSAVQRCEKAVADVLHLAQSKAA